MIQALRLTFVPRWCIVPMHRHQSVAEHSFRVSIIAGAIATKLGFGPALVNGIMTAALLHDKEEAISGDIPNPYKRQGNVGLYVNVPLTTGSECIVQVADRYEALVWIRAWGSGPRVPGIIAGIEGELAESVSNASRAIEGFIDAYMWVRERVESEE
jgi:hypothetical protein